MIIPKPIIVVMLICIAYGITAGCFYVESLIKKFAKDKSSVLNKTPKNFNKEKAN